MTRPIARLLDENAELQPLARRLELIKRLQRRYRAVAPEPLAEASRVCAVDGTTVVIFATSGPVAAALRQIAPRLLEGLRGNARKSSKHSGDQELNGIRIEVQVKERTVRPRVIARSEMPPEALERAARRMSEGPLKETLERIAREQAARKKPR